MFVALLIGLGDPAAKKSGVSEQLHRVRRFYGRCWRGDTIIVDSRLRDLETVRGRLWTVRRIGRSSWPR